MKKLFALLISLLLVAQPASAETAQPLWDLQRTLSSLVGESSADLGVAVLDLKSGQSVSVRGNRRYPMASTVKIAVAAMYLANVEHGHRRLDDRIAGQSAARLMERMIINSDNPATDLLLRDMGGPDALQDWIQRNNISNIRVDRTIAQLLRAKRDLWDDRDSATPLAMVQLLQRLHDGKLLRPESRDHLFGLMARCKTGRNRMKALLPWGTPVEHKTGTLNGLTGDVGFITMPDGRRLAVAFFARGGSDRPSTIARAARAVYDGFYRLIWSPGAAAITTG